MTRYQNLTTDSHCVSNHSKPQILRVHLGKLSIQSEALEDDKPTRKFVFGQKSNRVRNFYQSFVN